MEIDQGQFSKWGIIKCNVSPPNEEGKGEGKIEDGKPIIIEEKKVVALNEYV